jgi:hypothetical protein
MESESPKCLVAWAGAGETVYQPGGKNWVSPVGVRSFFWPDRAYSLVVWLFPGVAGGVLAVAGSEKQQTCGS